MRIERNLENACRLIKAMGVSYRDEEAMFRSMYMYSDAQIMDNQACLIDLIDLILGNDDTFQLYYDCFVKE